MTSRESFQLMEAFINTLPSEPFRNRLQHALDQPKPFQHFKEAVDNSGYRQQWFTFREARMVEWLRQQLSVAHSH